MTYVEVIPTRPGMGRSLVEHDPRSLNFPATDLFGATRPRDKVWRRGGAYDQGQTSTCVAQTAKGILNSSPLSATQPYAKRVAYSIEEFYTGAQRNDQWPGEEPSYYGTSGLGVCKHLLSVGLIQEYRWCFGLDDVLLTLSHYGPVGIGVNWYESMFYPEDEGRLSISGPVAGGHEVELIGVDTWAEEVIGMNSWGERWGDRGRFRLSYRDLARLLSERGDAFTVVR